jgi:hypothetical protein
MMARITFMTGEVNGPVDIDEQVKVIWITLCNFLYTIITTPGFIDVFK